MNAGRTQAALGRKYLRIFAVILTLMTVCSGLMLYATSERLPVKTA